MTIVNEFTSAAVSDRGLNASRPHNEDSFLDLAEIGLFAVADGVGGAQAGEVASQMAVEILAEAFTNMSADADPEETMRLALKRANEAIFQMSHDLAQLSSMATTVAAVHISGDMATIAHVGDSRVYRIDGSGRLSRETDDHSVVEEEVRAGRMTPEQALNHPSRNVISRALGADDTVEPDVRIVLIHPGTTFLLCSDGITRHIGDPEIESLLIPGHDPAAVCARMKEICFERGAEDNLTAVIVSFPGGAEQAADDDLIDEVTIAGVRLTDTESALGQTISPEVEDPEVWDEGARPTAVTGDAADSNEEPVMERPRDVNAHLNQESSTDYPDEASAEADYAPSGRIPDDSDENTADPIPVKHAEAHPSYSYVNAEPSRGPGRVIGWLIAGLIIGLAAGLGTGYFVVQQNLPAVPAPVLYEQKSNNVPLTSFEETRRLVDADPVKYLNANAVTPQEADDYFWLGRALLLTGKPVEARRAFEEAKRRLPGVAEPSNVKTMSNEIAMALIIAANPASAEAFAKEVAAGTSLAADANVNANAVGPIR